MLSLRVVPSSSAPSHYRCVGCTAASAQPDMARFASFSCPRLPRFVHRRQRRATGFLFPSASASTDSRSKAQSNTLLLKHRSLVLGPSGVQVAPWFPSSSGLTLPSSGPAFGSPLKSNVSALARSMKRSVVHAHASGGGASKRSGPLSLRQLHSGLCATRHVALCHLQLSSAASLRAPASKAGKRGSLTERIRTDRQLPQRPEQYTSGLASLAGARSKWRSSSAPLLSFGRANLSFKRTRLRRSA